MYVGLVIKRKKDIDDLLSERRIWELLQQNPRGFKEKLRRLSVPNYLRQLSKLNIMVGIYCYFCRLLIGSTACEIEMHYY